MSRDVCCEWHDCLPEAFSDDVTPDDCWDECGLAGMGRPSVCCKNCPQYKYFVEQRGILPYLVVEIMAMPVENRP